MKEWITQLPAHEKLTPEAQQVLDKFETPIDAHVGYVELQKTAGKPFKLPESMDKLPDDKTRGEFTAGLSKLLGKDVTSIASEDDLKDVNFAEGLADASKVNQDFVGAFKKFAVQRKYSKSESAELVKFNNSFVQQALTAHVEAQQAQAQKDLDDTRKVLSPLFGGDEGIKQNQEQVRRMFQNHAGLTVAEYEQSPKSLIDVGILRDSIIAKAMFNLASKFKEGSTEGAQQQTGGKPKELTIVDELPKTAVALGWKK